MDAETLAALKGSIAKWDAIAAGTGADRGGKNCPLCAMFCQYGDCEGCPVMEYTGYSDCSDTPYSDWWKACRRDFGAPPPRVKGGAYATTDELKALARTEADFLRSLLPEGETAP